jgi:hypothetical protein
LVLVGLTELSNGLVQVWVPTYIHAGMVKVRCSYPPIARFVTGLYYVCQNSESDRGYVLIKLAPCIFELAAETGSSTRLCVQTSRVGRAGRCTARTTPPTTLRPCSAQAPASPSRLCPSLPALHMDLTPHAKLLFECPIGRRH